ncbi:hypothetical protein like AT3G53010 [Hibiscus trionum]|uniref:Sialate O-acetylesterase domain-containing protein n=1 Tax=Hibiscus trionum TaxID=183268 RepID=A0A9W7IAZ6_HIBTR|nr:hypothetical protein like AT3G53010 [Hibiscus trionum]
MLSFIVLALLAHASQLQCQNLLHHKLNVIILAGQSNMVGRGGVINDSSTDIPTWDGVVRPQCQPNPSIFRLSANLAWVRARKTDGVGPGMSFANAVLTKDPNFGPVGLVSCAVGGTTIKEWQKWEFLYEQLVKRAQMAQQSGGVYKAMLWYQGEADIVNQEDAELYQGRLKTFFNGLCSDLHTPMLPIFQVVLALGEGPYIEESQVRLGEMLADVYLRFLPRYLWMILIF